ncbi:hypothetical protein LCI18_008337 [Fusarium solani-melongenae]|uniref:Uncharacterized protein n=1 Tax=Fusarium solani subsp. cucurbitae TaxID=2747967 RepID=A0ACD3Z8I9_FUSSC|nr:hypothetical protein LCI18_008337 [Fusarium solani-melongenae]
MERLTASTIWPFVIVYVLCWVLVTLIRPFVSPLRRVPGPFLARYTRLWLFKETYRGTFPKTNVELHKKHGPIVRIAPNECSIDDPAAVKLIYGSGKGFVKSPWYQASGNPYSTTTNIFSEPNPHLHSAARRKIASAYSMTSLVQVEPFVDECTALLIQKMDEFASSGASVDIAHWMQCFAFDVIGKMTVGERFGFLDSGEDVQGVMASLSDYLDYCARVGIFPEWHKTLYNRLKQSKKLTGVLNVRKFAVTQLQAKYGKLESDEEKADTKPTDFITKFLRIHNQEPSKISKDDISTVCVMNVGAGSDTTSIAFTAALFYLVKYPRVLSCLREEIKYFESRGLISDPISFSEAQKMPYTQALIKEALGMHPATGLILGRAVPAGGATLAGQYFPPGTIVGINSWVAHANQDVFGPDVEVFRPERWLEEEEVVKKRDAYFMAFGQGSRTCIGKNISIMELSKVLPQVIRHFDFVPDTPSGKPELRTENVWFVKIRGFHCKVRKRAAV